MAWAHEWTTALPAAALRDSASILHDQKSCGMSLQVRVVKPGNVEELRSVRYFAEKTARNARDNFNGALGALCKAHYNDARRIKNRRGAA